jgi:hypothetical protein
MFQLNRGLLFIVLLAVEIGLAMAYGYHAAYGDARADRAAQEYLAHPTPENKTSLDAERERLYAPGRKRNREIKVLLIANSSLVLVVGYYLVKKK